MSPLVREYEVPGDDFARAGEASGHIKSMLKELGFAPAMIRRVAITTYEAEINMVIHADGGTATVDIGLAQLAMHSCYETAAVSDAIDLETAMAAYYGSTLEATESGFSIL